MATGRNKNYTRGIIYFHYKSREQEKTLIHGEVSNSKRYSILRGRRKEIDLVEGGKTQERRNSS